MGWAGHHVPAAEMVNLLQMAIITPRRMYICGLLLQTEWRGLCMLGTLVSFAKTTAEQTRCWADSRGTKITYCREQFNFGLPSVILARHTSLFSDILRHCDNCLIKKFNVMRTELTCSVLISFIFNVTQLWS